MRDRIPPLLRDRELCHRDIRTLLDQGFVAPLPAEARRRIREFYGCELTLRGTECRGIGELRRLIRSLDPDSRFAQALFISAAHTHWENHVIIESFDVDRGLYVIGPAKPDGMLTPYSFVFSPEGPVAYEWADETVPLDASEVADVVDFVVRLNTIVLQSELRLPIPLGITIDHRFKTSIWNEQLYSFAEGPSDEENGRALIESVVESVVRPNPARPNTVQVAWSAFPEDELFDQETTEAETGFLLQIEDALRTRKPHEGLVFVNEIEASLRALDRSA